MRLLDLRRRPFLPSLIFFSTDGLWWGGELVLAAKESVRGRRREDSLAVLPSRSWIRDRGRDVKNLKYPYVYIPRISVYPIGTGCSWIQFRCCSTKTILCKLLWYFDLTFRTVSVSQVQRQRCSYSLGLEDQRWLELWELCAGKETRVAARLSNEMSYRLTPCRVVLRLHVRYTTLSVLQTTEEDKIDNCLHQRTFHEHGWPPRWERASIIPVTWGSDLPKPCCVMPAYVHMVNGHWWTG